ncbi:lysylphosphatidylglycerol synthase transmembrane domain-containing protein [Micromonospora mangrovi]|uniref:Lysylphosphatidylglycerol synthase transmembrane domain-containing protein n=2 Tax=Micromonospora TaxID=1873 RepID=A0AAU7MEC3_9ACTN
MRARRAPISPRTVFLLMMLVLLGVFVLTRRAQVTAALHALRDADPATVTAALLASAATIPLAAWGLRLAAADRIPFGTTVAVQLASAFVNRLAPGAVGGVALSLRYLRRQGLPMPVAATTVAVDRITGVLAVALLLPVLLPFARGSGHHLLAATVRRGPTLLLAAAVTLLVVAVLLAVPRLRARVRTARRQAVTALRSLARSGRVLRLLGASAALTLTYAGALWLSLLAVGLQAEAALLAPVVLVSVVGEGVASAAPTPGGLGATEAALVSGLLLYGVPVDTAVAGVLVYRLATFWLPVLPGYLALRVLVRRQVI